jgi:YidC/Oxa1 family membrane protein insertase
MNLMVSPANSGSVTANFIERLPYFIAVAAVVASGWYQMWQTQMRQKRLGSAAQNNPINRQMQVISRVFPIVFGWFSYIASSGLVLYFVTSSLWRIGQQHLVLNKYYEEHAREMGTAPKKKEALPPAAKPEATPKNGSGSNSKEGSGAQNGERAKSQPSQHTSRKKRKRRR